MEFFCKLLANLFIHCEWILLLKGFSMCKRSSWWRSFCRGAALVSCFGKALQRKCFLAVDAICIITSAGKLFWIRQIMAALVGSRVLNDELHFDTFSVLLCDFTFSQLLLFASIVIYHSWLYFLPYSLGMLCLSPCLLCVPSVVGSVSLLSQMLQCPSHPTFPLNILWSPCQHWQSRPQWGWGDRLWKLVLMFWNYGAHLEVPWLVVSGLGVELQTMIIDYVGAYFWWVCLWVNIWLSNENQIFCFFRCGHNLIKEPTWKKIVVSEKMKTSFLENVFWKNDYKG